MNNDLRMREKAPIYLTGFSGTGKSTLGQAIAFQMNRSFFDLDKEIELLSGLTVARFIQEKGESAFRDFEEQILFSLSMTESSVIALGGGAIIRPNSLAKIKRLGCLIYLSSSIERIKNNLSNQKIDRPLIKRTDDIELLFKEREPNYLKADIILEMTSQSIKEASDQLIERYSAWIQSSTLN